MVGFRWSIRLLLCVAFASGGCTGPIPGLQPRPPADALVGRGGKTPQGNLDPVGPTLNAPGSSRTTSAQEGAPQPAGVATANSFSSTDVLEQADQARLDALLEQLGAVDPARRRQLEEQIAKSPTARTYALQLLPSYLQGLTPRPVQTANPRAEIEALLQPVKVPPATTADATAGYAGSAADYAGTQQEFERMATHGAPSPPPLGGRPVFTASTYNPSQDPAAIYPPSSTGSPPPPWTPSHAQSTRQSPRASHDTPYNSEPYGAETHSTLLAGQPRAGFASTGAVGPGATRASYEGLSGSAFLDGSSASPSDSPSPDSWRDHLAATIRAYESQLSDEPRPKAELDRHVADHARLRLLYLAADSGDCARDIPAASPAEQEFWKDELFGLRILLDTEGHPDSRHRSAVAAGNLESALDRLTQMSKLLVEHTTFVRGVDSWGVYEPFPSTNFAPGTRVMIYAEIKNFVSHETEKGHETKLRGGYEIFVRHGGQSMVEHDFGVVDETCRNRRHDYFVRYVFTLPTSLNPGKYILRLTINDLHGGSVAQQDVEFSITTGE